MSHLLWKHKQAGGITRAGEVEGKTGAADKGINPEAAVFSTLSQPVFVRRCSVMITTLARMRLTPHALL